MVRQFATAVKSVAMVRLDDGSDSGGRAPGRRGESLMKGGCDPGHPEGVQLLRSNSVAVSTSQDFDDKAAITAFCRQGGRDSKQKMS